MTRASDSSLLDLEKMLRRLEQLDQDRSMARAPQMTRPDHDQSTGARKTASRNELMVYQGPDTNSIEFMLPGHRQADEQDNSSNWGQQKVPASQIKTHSLHESRSSHAANRAMIALCAAAGVLLVGGLAVWWLTGAVDQRDAGPAIAAAPIQPPADSSAASSPINDRPAAAETSEEAPEKQITATNDQINPEPTTQAASSDGPIQGPANFELTPGVPTNLPIVIAAGLQQSTGHYVLVSGLIPGSKFSKGAEILPDTWLLSAADWTDAQLELPRGIAREIETSIELRGPAGATIGIHSVVLRVVDAPGLGGALRLAETDARADSPATPDIKSLIRKAEWHIDAGSLDAARLFLREAADLGSTQATLALATSYDPQHAPELLGGQAGSAGFIDVEKARIWYNRALALGVRGAQSRLERLSGRSAD